MKSNRKFKRLWEVGMLMTVLCLTMMMAMGTTFNLSNVEANNLLTTLNTNIGAGSLGIYNGADPGPNGALTTQVLVANFTLPAAGSNSLSANATYCILTVGAIANVTISNTQTAAWFRLLTSGAANVADGDVGTAATSIVFNSAAFVSGATANLSAFQLNMPHG